MAGWLIRWILNFFAVILTASIIKGFEVTVPGAIFGSITLGIINAIIRPIVIMVTLPLNVITLGLFTLVINGLMIWLAAAVIKGFDIHSFTAAIISALFISIFSFVINLLVKD
ncbi:phage holin family protein [Pelotomaculum terephthalicicum JT]|uniref:phage holin family protein n=1 Tax=Pelotomaculum TaxID=191373 RepID=UPI0009CDF954|nr:MULTISPECIES: phage holin family protein [Pelotomaculum]MCG9967593.1 phage holin family protein [Pelotomaculum terephthalicicum JT]OPX91674.1 MAG: Membrane protein of unknown function [Pelotomaculum sp. PtaB.Bin117]OPY61824.1 MAG: Membrane protein of unknown function [Pelotomaculum sp. PtaU1.Bin065]